MTTYTDLELDRVLDEFLGEGPAAAPERTIEAALGEITGVRQRRSTQPFGRFRVSTPVRLVLAAALVVAAVAAGAAFIGSRQAQPTPIPTPSPTASPAALTSEQAAWCTLHLGGPGEDQHQVEDMALSLGVIPGATTREDVFGRWAGQTGPDLQNDPTYRAACAAAFAAAPPAASASLQPTAPPASPVVTLSKIALARVDAAIEGATTSGSPVSDAQTRLFRLTDAIREPLLAGNVPGAITAFDPLPTAADEVATTLDDASATQLRTAVATLGSALRATPFVPEALAAGPYHTTAFTPLMALQVPDGWARRLEDREVLMLGKGKLTLGIHKLATEATATGLAKALGRGRPEDLAIPPVAVRLPSYAGFAGGIDDGAGTLWFTDAQQAFDAAAGDVVRAWVLDAAGRPLTIDLVGPPDEVAAALPEVESMLASLIVAPSTP